MKMGFVINDDYKINWISFPGAAHFDLVTILSVQNDLLYICLSTHEERPGALTILIYHVKSIKVELITKTKLIRLNKKLVPFEWIDWEVFSLLFISFGCLGRKFSLFFLPLFNHFAIQQIRTNDLKHVFDFRCSFFVCHLRFKIIRTRATRNYRRCKSFMMCKKRSKQDERTKERERVKSELSLRWNEIIFHLECILWHCWRKSNEIENLWCHLRYYSHIWSRTKKKNTCKKKCETERARGKLSLGP